MMVKEHRPKHWMNPKLDPNYGPLHKNCTALFSKRPKQTRAWAIVVLMALTFSCTSHNTIMLHCGNGCALHQTITRQPPLPCHLPALFMPGLHYEVQRKSSPAIWKNLQDKAAVQVMPHRHKEQLGGVNWWKVARLKRMHPFWQNRHDAAIKYFKPWPFSTCWCY